MSEQAVIAGCGCEPCPADLTVLFPGAKVFYEDPSFIGSRCQWHWIIRFSKAKHMTVCLSGKTKDGTRWLWVDRMPKRGMAVVGDVVEMEPVENGQSSVTCQVPTSSARALDALFQAVRK